MESPHREPAAEIEEVQKVPWGFRGISSGQLIKALGIVEKLGTSKVEVKNLDRILHLSEDKNCIIATSHKTDSDIQIIGHQLGSYFDLVLTNQSTQHSLREDAPSYGGTFVAGHRNFRPIDYQPTNMLFKNSKNPTMQKISNPFNPGARPFAFNPDNFHTMKKDLDEGKTVMIAAHNPSDEFKLENGGLGMVYLAQIDNATILPVALRMSKAGVGNAGATDMVKTIQERGTTTSEVLVGEPLTLPPIQNIEKLKPLIDKHKAGEILSDEEQGEFRWLGEQLRWQSEFVMSKIADLYTEQSG